MIGKLKGVIEAIEDEAVIVDVGGVGYVCHCPAPTIAGLPGRGQPIELFVETIVREDMIRLYGFASHAEKQWFRRLMGVQGVGARVALGVLSVLSPTELAHAIAIGDKKAVGQAPGAGPKLAQRIVSELEGQVPAGTIPETVGTAAGNGRAEGPAADAVSALVNLGYPQLQASMAVSKVLAAEGDGTGVEALIRLGLRELSR
jgi:Holliday junction DNA helicase RuvA